MDLLVLDKIINGIAIVHNENMSHELDSNKSNSVQAQLTNLPQATRDRIAHIDFTLLFKGEAVRADLVDRFSIAAAQANERLRPIPRSCTRQY